MRQPDDHPSRSPIEPAPRPLTLLHISDMQFGRHHRFGRLGEGTEGDQAFDTLLARLTQDLDNLAGEHALVPDLVFLTGDLAEWGRKSEFEDVLAFAAALAHHLGLPRERFILIPGNHDINRSACESYFLACEADEEEPRKPYWPKWKHFVRLFRSFYGTDARVELTEQMPWSLFVFEDLKVVVAGLDSTMAESHLDSDHYGYLGEEQLRWFEHALAPYRDRGWLRVAALHHNVRRGPTRDDENLRDADDFTRILGGEVNLVLHGHTHDGKLDWLTPRVPILSTGSAAVAEAARPPEVPNQYQIVRVWPDRLERWTRAYAPDQRRWIGDNRGSRDGSAWRTEEAVGFDRVAGTFPRPRARAGRGHAMDLDGEPETGPDIGIDDWREERLDRDMPRRRRDDFLAQVERVCRIREEAAHPGGRVEVERKQAGWPPIEYLEVCVSVRGIASLSPVGAVERDMSRPALDEVIDRVHARYRVHDATLRSTLVYGGERVAEAMLAHARRHRVDLVSFVEYQGLIDFRAYVADQNRRLEADRIYPPALYVTQRLRYAFGTEEHAADDAIEQILGWLDAPDARFVLVLGDFGAGKSFLLRQVARRLGAGEGLVPILVEMRDLEKSRSLDELLAQHFARHGLEFSPSRLGYMLEAGRIALLFDGFDELALRVTYPRAAEHFEAVLEAARGKAKVVVTSRTQHFFAHTQVTAIGKRVRNQAGARIATVQPFDHAQIQRYLRNLLQDEARAAGRFALILEIQDLLGLSHNPRMLGFIAALDEADLRSARDQDGRITAASLYRTLVDRWLAHEHERMHPRGAPPGLGVAQLRDAVVALAVRMWPRTERTVSIEDLAEEAANLVERMGERRLDADVAAFQVGSGSLLVREGEGRFSFIHPSVLEWLVASRAAAEVNASGISLLLASAPMSELMVDFFVSMAGTEHAAAWARRVLAGDAKGHGEAKKNALKVVDRAGVPLDASAAAIAPRAQVELEGQDLSGQNLAGEDLRGANLVRANLSAANLAGADLSSAQLQGANLIGADLTRAVLRDADLRDADVSGATLMGADLRGARLEGAVLRRARLLGARHDAGALERCDTFGAALEADDYKARVASAQTSCEQVVWSPDGALIATAGDLLIRIWEAASGREISHLEGHEDGIMSMAFSPDVATLATGSRDRTVRLWDIASGREIRCLQDHAHWVTSVAFSPDSATLATGSEDLTVRLWDIASGREIRRLQDWASPDSVDTGVRLRLVG